MSAAQGRGLPGEAGAQGREAAPQPPGNKAVKSSWGLGAPQINNRGNRETSLVPAGSHHENVSYNPMWEVELVSIQQRAE